jgi:hypothetical protein
MNLPRKKGERKLRVVMLVLSEKWNVPSPYNAPFRRLLCVPKLVRNATAASHAEAFLSRTVGV